MNRFFKAKIICRIVVFALVFSLCGCSGKEPAASTVNHASDGQSTTEALTGQGEITTEGLTDHGQVTTEELTTTEEPTTESIVSTELVLATLNIKHGAQGLDTLATAIKEVSPDIIGLEEVDVGCERSDFTDEPAELARLAGYPYYAFSKAINLGDGEYGTALLSRYPIEEFEVLPLPSGNGEGRSLGHASIRVEGVLLHVFVTHLSYEDRQLRIDQMKTISLIMTGYDHYVLLGDLNSFNLEDISYLGADYYVNRPDRSYITFRRRDIAIDNIVLSNSFTELTSGVSERECSDHKLLFATVSFLGE